MVGVSACYGDHAWRHPDGDEAAIATLHKIAAAKFATRCQRGCFYPRFDMKIGFDMELFQDFSDDLSEYINLDSRGGYFLQEHMVAAITHAANDEGNRSAFGQFTSTNDLDPPEAVETIAYQTRVVLSHFREKYKAFNALDAATRLSATLPSHPQWLRTLYEIVDSKISKTTKKKQIAPSSIRHPLRAFRLEQSSKNWICSFRCLQNPRNRNLRTN